jgi:hypothetical protein
MARRQQQQRELDRVHLVQLTVARHAGRQGVGAPYGAVQCGAVRCSAVRCGAVRCGAGVRTGSSRTGDKCKHIAQACKQVCTVNVKTKSSLSARCGMALQW